MFSKLRLASANLVRDLRNEPDKRWELGSAVLAIVLGLTVAIYPFGSSESLTWLVNLIGWELNGWTGGVLFLIALLLSLAIAVSTYLIVRVYRWKPILIILAIAVITVIVSFIWVIQGPVEDDLSIFGTRLTLTVGAIGAALLSTVGALNLLANYRRANTSEKQQAQELFVNSIRNLGDDKEIIRIGAIHGLRQLAKDSSEAWSDRVSEILCAHIRNTTTASPIIKHSIRPSRQLK